MKDLDGSSIIIYLQYLQTASQKQQKSVLNAKSENKNRVYFKNLITTKNCGQTSNWIYSKSWKQIRTNQMQTYSIDKKVYKILITKNTWNILFTWTFTF